MDNVRFAAEAAWKVLLAGLVLGAGLPAVFALGIRSLAFGQGGSAEVENDAPAHPVGKLLAALCFAIVALGIILGIVYIVATGFGKELNFSHIYPTLVDKKK